MEEQALAIFNQAAEQMRFERGLQWQIAEYALLAYAALAAASFALTQPGRGHWVCWPVWARWLIRGIAVFLVVVTFYQGWDGLYNSEARRLLAGDRQKTAIEELHKAACGGLAERECVVPSIHKIYRDNPPVDPSNRPHPFQTPWAGRLPLFPYGLLAALFVGASFANVIILSPLRWLATIVTIGFGLLSLGAFILWICGQR